MRGIKRHRKTLVRYAQVTGAATGKTWISQQMNIQGALQDVQIHFPYGLHANCTPGNTLAVVMNLNETSDNVVGFPWNPNTRPTLAVDEVALYSPEHGQLIKLNASGGIEITGEDLDITVNGSANITGNVNIVGDLQVSGEIIADGEVTAGNAVPATAVKVTSHTTSAVTVGTGTSGPPTPGS